MLHFYSVLHKEPMRKPNTTQRAFQDRFIAEAERRVGMSRYTRGFMTEVARSLKLRQVSVVQRWLEGWMPRLPHLLKIYQEWGITPNELLGIEEEPRAKKTSKKNKAVSFP
jgi:hypothetical protein